MRSKQHEQKADLPPYIGPLFDAARQGTMSAETLASQLALLPDFLSDDDATIRIARLVGALQTDSELEERGRLLRMRGSPDATGRTVTATQVTPITTKRLETCVESFGNFKRDARSWGRIQEAVIE